MRRKVAMGLAVCLSLLLAGGLALRWATREPLCQGRPVRAWVEQIGNAPYDAATTHAIR